ncbi:MAG TPA: carboxypeptidase regulatory-like domain-containing protein, partial [Chitinophagaceae bacterium]|nr:carboxypeptidase regulatory-like domain-containing protein [Chitinophagaceae bacterium]
MKKLKLLLSAAMLLLLYMAPSLLQAQTVTVTGTIKNETGEPLAGVTVSLKGSKTSVQTDVTGKYSIQAP